MPTLGLRLKIDLFAPFRCNLLPPDYTQRAKTEAEGGFPVATRVCTMNNALLDNPVIAEKSRLKGIWLMRAMTHHLLRNDMINFLNISRYQRVKRA